MCNYYQSYLQLDNMFRFSVAGVECGNKAVVIERDEFAPCPLDIMKFNGMSIYTTEARLRSASILANYAKGKCTDRLANNFSTMGHSVFVFNYDAIDSKLEFKPFDPKVDTFDNSRYPSGFIVFDKDISSEDAKHTVKAFVDVWNVWVIGDNYQIAMYEDGKYIDGITGLYGIDAYMSYSVNGFENLFYNIAWGYHKIIDETTGEILEHYSL